MTYKPSKNFCALPPGPLRTRQPSSVLGSIWVWRFEELCSKEWKRVSKRAGMVAKPPSLTVFWKFPGERPDLILLRALWFVPVKAEARRPCLHALAPSCAHSWGCQRPCLSLSPPLTPRALDTPIRPAPEPPDTVHRPAALVPPHGTQRGDCGVSDSLQQQPHPARAPVDPAHHGR